MKADDGGISFERAAAEDAYLFVTLERDAGDPKIYGPCLDIESARREIENNSLYFIRRGDSVVGTAAYRIRPDGSIYISNVAIAPACRRQGIARAAMMFILEMNKAARRFDLVTHPENASALRLYGSLGFRMESRQENYLGDGEPRLLLARE